MVTLMNEHIYEIYQNNAVVSGENGAVIMLDSDEDDYKDRWLNFTYQIKWSALTEQENRLDPGFIRIWLGGKKQLECHGEIGFRNKLGPYLKFGVYAKRDVINSRIVYHDSYIRALDGSPGSDKIRSNLMVTMPTQSVDGFAKPEKSKFDAGIKLDCDREVFLYDTLLANR